MGNDVLASLVVTSSVDQYDEVVSDEGSHGGAEGGESSSTDELLYKNE